MNELQAAVTPITAKVYQGGAGAGGAGAGGKADEPLKYDHDEL